MTVETERPEQIESTTEELINELLRLQRLQEWGGNFEPMITTLWETIFDRMNTSTEVFKKPSVHRSLIEARTLFVKKLNGH